jgi:hypothetical protein
MHIAVYDEIERAQHAAELLDEEFEVPAEDMTLLARDAGGAYAGELEDLEVPPIDDEEAQQAGAVRGAGLGGTVGALGALWLAVEAVTVPVIGPIVAAGPLVATLVGAAGGAAVGGVVGGLVELGVPEREAELYAEALRRGGAMLVVQTDEADDQTVVDVLGRFEPVDLDRRAEQWRKRGWSGYDEESEPLDRESVNAERARAVEGAASSEEEASASRVVQPATGSASATAVRTYEDG